MLTAQHSSLTLVNVTLGKQEAHAGDLADQAVQLAGLHKRVALGLQDLFVCLGCVDDECLLVEEAEIAHKMGPRPLAVPFLVEANGGRIKKDFEELAEEGVVVLSCQLGR